MGNNRSFLYLMTAQAVSNLGDWIDLLALFSLVALEWRASSVEMTLLVLCLAVPVVLFGPPAGVLADRHERKTLMMAADLVRAVAGPALGGVLVGALGIRAAFFVDALTFLLSALVLLGMLGLWQKNQIERREIHVAESNGGT
ncbi:MFS transporter [Brevibacillus sp. SYP-B805]|uniref:MFS transporter n=1 Tax=Brevibacillus sp. SYP-B805 TaxID=1578199 RepID=UPI0013EAD312|nr:MFS transporter [Brevibacillus sp. SYP-B805]NGQ96783.1 MFS transporter [Brevibacillus sp. SYP-B805]